MHGLSALFLYILHFTQYVVYGNYTIIPPFRKSSQQLAFCAQMRAGTEQAARTKTSQQRK